jgi:holo-[acyl-carrier protein] synthase
VTGAVVGVGIDSVDLDRFGAVLSRRPAMRARLFSAGEQAALSGLNNPLPSLAARFAAKEAAMKALGVGLGAFDWIDVSVVRAPGGRPSLSVTGRAASLAADAGVASWQVSLTHTGLTASAVVLALS